MQFSDIVGLEDLKANLVTAINSSHIAHAQLFAGNPGSANLPLALAYATYLNCTARLSEDACGICASCQKMAKFIHPDLHFVFPVSSTKDVTGKDVVSSSFMKDWRAFLKKNMYGSAADWSNFFGGENKQLNISKEESRHIIKDLSLKSFEGKYKVMLIWLPEYMNPACANGILKILEEPPENTVFLMVANQTEGLLMTILSRTQMVRIRSFTDAEISKILVDTRQIDAGKANQVAHLADGNLTEALVLVEDVEDNSHHLFRDWMRLCYTQDFTQLVSWTEIFGRMNKVAQKGFLQYGLTMMRETLLAHYAKTLGRLQGEEEIFIDKFSQSLAPDKIEQITNHLNQAHYHLERNANTKILFLDLSIAIAKSIRS